MPREVVMTPATRVRVLAAGGSQPFTVFARPAGKTPRRKGPLDRFRPDTCRNHQGYLADSRRIGPRTEMAELPLPCRGCWELVLIAPACGARLPLGEVPPTGRDCCLTIDLREPSLSG